MAGRHGVYPKEVILPRSAHYDSRRFGRMFGKLPPWKPTLPTIDAGRHCADFEVVDLLRFAGVT